MARGRVSRVSRVSRGGVAERAARARILTCGGVRLHSCWIADPEGTTLTPCALWPAGVPARGVIPRGRELEAPSGLESRDPGDGLGDPGLADVAGADHPLDKIDVADRRPAGQVPVDSSTRPSPRSRISAAMVGASATVSPRNPTSSIWPIMPRRSGVGLGVACGVGDAPMVVLEGDAAGVGDRPMAAPQAARTAPSDDASGSQEAAPRHLPLQGVGAPAGHRLKRAGIRAPARRRARDHPRDPTAPRFGESRAC